jgi:hypothetical protein
MYLIFIALLELACGSKRTADDDDHESSSGRSGSGGATGGTTSAGGTTAAGGRGGTVAAGGKSSAAGAATAGASSGGSESGGSSAAGSSSGGSGGRAGAGTGGSGGSAGAGTGGSGGAAGAAPGAVCTNAFGKPTLLVPDTPGVIPESLSVTGDDLELFDVEKRPDGAHLLVRARTDRSAAFGDATELDASLWSWCSAPADPNLDVSDDGLRLYMTCIDTTTPDANGGFPSGPIRVAERATRDAPFSLNPNDFGTGNVSISVSQDELTAFWSDYTTTTNPLPVMATRTSRTEPFGAPMAIAGIVDTLRNPELANDGLHLFGSLQILNADFHLYMLTRGAKSAPFQSPTPQYQIFPSTVGGGSSEYTPTVSGDCNSLYFMLRTMQADGSYTDEIYVAKR